MGYAPYGANPPYASFRIATKWRIHNPGAGTIDSGFAANSPRPGMTRLRVANDDQKSFAGSMKRTATARVSAGGKVSSLWNASVCPAGKRRPREATAVQE